VGGLYDNSIQKGNFSVTRITVNVPATTANLGPGFDCLGLALDWWNTMRVEPAQEMQVQLRGDSEGLAADTSNTTIVAMQELFKHLNQPLPPLRVTMTNRIPIGRGFGSSAAAIVGGLVAANTLAGNQLSQDALLALANEIEGHPDNTSAALLGGLTIIVEDAGKLVSARLAPPRNWRAVVFVPKQALSTKFARSVLPKKLTRADAVFNIGRAALLTYAFANGDTTLLNIATQDRLHQPYREPLVVGMKEMLDAVRAAGASGAALSGAGPSLIAFAPNSARAARVREAFTQTARARNIQGEARIIKLSARGAYVQ